MQENCIVSNAPEKKKENEIKNKNNESNNQKKKGKLIFAMLIQQKLKIVNSSGDILRALTALFKKVVESFDTYISPW